MNTAIYPTENGLKKALADNDVQIGLWLALASPACAEIAAHAGFDWALIDAEHGPNDLATILQQLRAIEGAPVEPVVRIPSADPVWVARALDLGVRSLLVPMVETAAQAAKMAEAARFPPDGKRGIGGDLIRATGYRDHADYVARAAANTCLMVQVESRKALDNIEAIAAVDGIDCLFIGPADLAADMGHLGNPGAPEVVAAIDDAIARIRKCGKSAGIVTFDRSAIGDFVAKGVTFLGVGGDAVILSQALRALAIEARGHLESH
jgi:4-hydroxy-2-oxoheptanedioate aldolase